MNSVGVVNSNTLPKSKSEPEYGVRLFGRSFLHKEWTSPGHSSRCGTPLIENCARVRFLLPSTGRGIGHISSTKESGDPFLGSLICGGRTTLFPLPQDRSEVCHSRVSSLSSLAASLRGRSVGTRTYIHL